MSPAGGCQGFLLLCLGPHCRPLFSRFLLFPSLQARSVGFFTSRQLQGTVPSPWCACSPPGSSPTSGFKRCQETSEGPVQLSLFLLLGRAGFILCPHPVLLFSFLLPHQLRSWHFCIVAAPTWRGSGVPRRHPSAWAGWAARALGVRPVRAGNASLPARGGAATTALLRSCSVLGRARVSAWMSWARSSRVLCCLSFPGAPCSHRRDTVPAQPW